MPSEPVPGMKLAIGPGHRAPTDKLNDYNLALGDALALPADLAQTFTGVISQIFPLAADLGRMQFFLDRYLNFPSDGEAPPVYFRPAAPFVMLEVLNYSSVASNVANVGWFSQHEIAFGMPLEWYARDGDHLRFLTHALIYPYIYVDNSVSLSGGRQIYGWSKAPVKLVPTAAVFEPANTQTLLSLKLLAKGDEPAALEPNLLRIRQRKILQPSASSLPGLLTAIPNAITASLQAAVSLLQSSGSGSGGYAGNHAQLLFKMLPRFYGDFRQYLPQGLRDWCGGHRDPLDAPTSIITLKEIRDIQEPNQPFRSLACYQGILESEMKITGLTDGGSLIDASSPDPSGGVYIDLAGKHPEPLQLGLEALELNTPDWGEVRRLKPLFPLWLEMDLTYGLADYQAWRTNKTYWTQENAPRLRETQHPIPYIGLGSGAAEEIAPPRNFPSVIMRVLPLPADGPTLDALLQQYLDNPFFSFVHTGGVSGKAVVALILSNFQNMLTLAPQSGTYADYELTFAIPAIWKNKTTGSSGTCLVPAYTLAGSYWNTVTSFEVYGRLTLKSRFVSPPFTAFMPPQFGPSGNLSVTVMTELFPLKSKAQELQDLPVVELYSVFPQAGAGTQGAPLSGFLAQIGLSQFADASPFFSVGLKQIRDANNPTKADYQAGVWLGRSFQPSNTEYYPQQLRVNLYEYENMSMVGQLGLIPDSVSPVVGPGPTQLASITAVNPITLSGAMLGTSADTGWWRIGNQPAVGNPSFNP